MISSDTKLRLKTFMCIIGMLFPIVLIFFGGLDVNSLSEYYYTDAKWAFVLICLLMSGNMITVDKWVVPAVLLMTIAIFPCKEFRILHNSSAIVFFLWGAVIMCKDKRLYWMGYVMLLSSILYAISLYWCEVIQIFLISAFHLKYLYRIRKVKKLRD
mgnify:CR=1 FL=1